MLWWVTSTEWGLKYSQLHIKYILAVMMAYGFVLVTHVLEEGEAQKQNQISIFLVEAAN